MRTRLLAGLIAVASLLAAVTIAQAASTVRFAGADGTPRARPGSVNLTADGTLEVVHATWQSWGGRTARGRGTADSHGCTPSCAAGRDHTQAVEVTMSDPVRCKRTDDFPAGVYYDTVRLSSRRGHALFTSYLRRQQWAPCRA